MKKVFLVLLIGFLTLMPGVKAECNNLVDDNVWYYVSYSGPSYYAHYSNTGNSYTQFTLDTTKSYTIYFEDLEPICSTCELYFFGKSFSISNNISFTVTPKSATSRIYFNTNNSDIWNSFKSRKLFLVEGDTICSNEPEEPDPVVPDSTLDTFYSIYLDKLGMLSNYAIENKFLFSSICIILLFIILEIILYLFKRGGYK